MNGIDFKLIVVLGTELERIRASIEQFENMHLGLFINSLRYKNEKEGKKLKGEFVTSTTHSVKLINKEISTINLFIKYFNKSRLTLSNIEKIDCTAIKKIILAHQGHHQQARGVSGTIQEIMGEGDSPSVLARKHTSLQIRNVILETKLSLLNFIKSIDRLLEVFDFIKRKDLRSYVQNEVGRAKTVYSVGLFGESIFILGHLLEKLMTEYILLLKKDNRISLTRKYIMSSNFDFHNKIEFLHSKKILILSNSQFSKLMSVKWDRNTYGHKVNLKVKDHLAMISIALMGIDFFDKKIVRIKQKLQK